MTDRTSGRRRFLGGLGGAAGLGLLGCAADRPSTRVVTASAGPGVGDALAAIERRLGGRLGVAVVDGGSGELLAGHRADERFAMCSTFKAPLAACVLRAVDRGDLALDARIPIHEGDLLDHAPVARARVAEGALPIEDLCAAAVEVSDNTAANLLLAQVGGPAGLTAFLRAIGDPVTRLDRDEPTLNTNVEDDPRDTTSPHAMASTMRAIVLGGEVLTTASRDRLVTWMIRSRTGLGRLRGGLPAGWLAGDKTGTGERGAANDVAVAWPPGRVPLVVACYVDAPAASSGARNASHVEVARLVADRIRVESE